MIIERRNVTSDMWHNYKYSLLSLHMKTKVVQHVPRINIWHVTCEMWHNYKYSLLSIDMKTKVVQHVPRTNISMSQTQSRSQSQTQTKTHRFPAFVMLTFLFLHWDWKQKTALLQIIRQRVGESCIWKLENLLAERQLGSTALSCGEVFCPMSVDEQLELL